MRAEILKRVSEELLRLNMPGEQLAEKLGCSRKTIYNYLNEVSVIKATHLRTLCELSGKSANYFLWGKEKG